jgi:hypothetical protein
MNKNEQQNITEHKSNCVNCPFYCNLIDLKIEQTGPKSVKVNSMANYIITVTNNSTINVSNIIIRNIYGSPTLSNNPMITISNGMIVNDGELQLHSGSFNWLIPLMKEKEVATLKLSFRAIQPGQILNYAAITNYIEIRKDVDFTNNESRVFTKVI